MQWLKKKWNDIKDFFNVLKELRKAFMSLTNEQLQFANFIRDLVETQRVDLLRLTANDRQYLLDEIEKLSGELRGVDESDKKELRDFDDQDKKELSKRIDDLTDYIKRLKVANQLKDR